MATTAYTLSHNSRPRGGRKGGPLGELEAKREELRRRRGDQTEITARFAKSVVVIEVDELLEVLLDGIDIVHSLARVAN